MDLNQSVVHRKLDSKLKIVGLEVHDLLFVLLFAAIMNLIFGQTALGFYLVFVVPSIMAGILFLAKRNKADGYLIHLIRYYVDDGKYSAGNDNKNEDSKRLKIYVSKL